MKNLKKLFSVLPNLGEGDVQEYNSTVHDIATAVDILNAGMDLIFMRAVYNAENENNPNSLSYRKWLKHIEENDDSYVSYLLKKGFKLDDNGEFILNISEKELDQLAKVFLKYKEII